MRTSVRRVYAGRKRPSISGRSSVVDDPPRSQRARAAAERALVRVIHHYGGRPEFVVLGGLVPELLCSGSSFLHTGTTDVDVQVDLEIACGSVNAERLERALRNSEFEPDDERVWRWVANTAREPITVEFELLADLNDVRDGHKIRFDGCQDLGAVNLRGTGFAARDVEIRPLQARVGSDTRRVEVNVSGLAGFLLAKIAAAHSRQKAKDWYDIAFVLLHNDGGGPEAAAHRVLEQFGDDLGVPMLTALRELAANFADRETRGAGRRAQGTEAYVSQMCLDHPDLDRTEVAADAVVGVEAFCRILLES
jgi:hypothetical protein